MAQETEPESGPAAAQAEEAARPEPVEETVADFITRNVLEKDTVFFEG
jgi:hypothetical protein